MPPICRPKEPRQFDDSWQDLLKSIQTKSHALKQTT